MAGLFSVNDRLCETCSRLDIRSLFQFGLQGPPLRPWQAPKNRPEAIYLGNLSQIGAKSTCPLCRLICQCALQEYGDYINPELLMKSSSEEVSCHLDTFPADWNKADLEETQDAGPPAWYIGFIFGDLRIQAKTWAKYLVLDARDAAPVDDDWTFTRNNDSNTDKTLREEEQDLMPPSVSKGRPDLKGQAKVYLYSGREMKRGSVDINLLQSWITFCDENHGCHLRTTHDLPQLRVINVHDRCVIQAPPSCQYAALSYVWGFVKILNSGKTLPDKLPQTIEDAILMVKLLGGMYLWVDAICINQEDPEDKAVQIQAMDRIYNGAWLTLIAGEGDDANAGLPGVRTGSRSYQQYFEVVDGLTIYISTPLLKESLSYSNANMYHIDQQPKQARRWINRGWTFQEGLLSDRCLIFTASQVFWKCRGEFCCESLQEPLVHQRKALTNSRHNELFCSYYRREDVEHGDIKIYVSTNRYYFDVVEAYSPRNLTYATDRIAGFIGLGKTLERRSGSSLFWGLPEDVFDHALLWMPKTHTEPRCDYFPSWSWTSSPGAVLFPLYHPERSTSEWGTLELVGKMLRVRRDHPYWKFSTDGTPRKILQTQTRYSMAVEEDEGIFKDNAVYMVIREEIIEGVTVHSFQIAEAEMERRPAPPSLNIQSFPQFPILENGILPLIGFPTVVAKLRIVSFNSDDAEGDVCRVRVQAEFEDVIYTSRDEDEFVWIDYQEDFDRLLGEECEFVLLSTLETTFSKTLNIMAVERTDQGFMRRLGIGFISQNAWDLAGTLREWVLIK